MKNLTALLLALLLAAGAAAQNGPPLGLTYPPSITGATGATGAAGATGAPGPAGPGPLCSMLAADATNGTDTMAALGLSVAVVNGTRYALHGNLMVSAGGGAEGSLFDFDASTSTATNFRVWTDDLISAVGGFVTSYAADIAGPPGGETGLDLRGSVELATSGTLAMRFGQAAHVSETLTVYRGSWICLWPL